MPFSLGNSTVCFYVNKRQVVSNSHTELKILDLFNYIPLLQKGEIRY